MRPCVKGCVRLTHRDVPSTIHYKSLDSRGELFWGESHSVPIPGALMRDYQTLIAQTVLANAAPTLEMYDRVGGLGGMFSPGDWTLMLGEVDLDRHARRYLDRYPFAFEAIDTETTPSPDGVLDTLKESLSRLVMAHEIGHAYVSRRATHPYGSNGEAGADYFAGRFIARCQPTLRALGARFFAMMGCRLLNCTHPTPDDRQAAFTRGFDLQMAGR